MTFTNPEKSFSRLISVINRIPAYPFIALLLFINFFTIVVLPNEEHYFALAKQFIDPTWLQNSFLLTEWPGERLFYQYIAGWLLSFLSFPATAAVGKLIIIICISYPLSVLFRKTELTNLEILFALQVFFFGNQTFFAGEFMIGTFEPKTIAYIFILFALVMFLKGNRAGTLISAVIATYFHFLVGGWFILYLNLYIIFHQFNLKKWLTFNLVYFVLVLPFIIYLINGVKDIPSEKDGILYNYLITVVRNPWHTVIDYTQFFGIILMISALVISYVFISKHTHDWALQLNRLNICIMLTILAFVMISFFDKTYFFSKFFPYRGASFSLLLFILTFAVALKNLFQKNPEIIEKVSLIMLALLIPFVLKSLADQYYRIKQADDKKLTEIYSYIRQHTQKDDTFLFAGYNYASNVKTSFETSFSRETDRPLMVLFKFAKYDANIYEWYERFKACEEIKKDPHKIKEVAGKYGVDYIISKNELDENSGCSLILDENGNRLYKVNNDPK